MADGKWIAGLTPEIAITDAARLVLGTRFEVVRLYLPLAAEKPDEDWEYVHQLRVGTRRAGAALRVFKDCLPRKHLRSAKASLRTLRRAAGDARDWDVFQLGLAEAKALNSATGKPARDFLTGYAMGERSAAQVRLHRVALDHGPEFLEESQALTDHVHEPKTEDAPTTFGELAVNRFGVLLGAFSAAAEANPTDPIALHQFRILAKRVRYALEIFASCFPETIREEVYPVVEQVQEILGEIQDAVVGLNRLTSMRKNLKAHAPETWMRVQKGFEGLVVSLRSRVPAGRKAFQKWRKQWDVLTQNMKLEIVAATITTEEPSTR